VLSPRGIRMRYRDSRLTAEVDITRQVLVLGRNGVIQKIVDVSTGSEQYYYQDGVRYRAHTPRGVFRVYRKIDGIRISKLGELYRPSYFYQGWAVHGSGSVPTYPASHGCVRITNPVADRLFSLLAIGTRVAVYDE
jgi:lipoprotein-anchoring transpeptidase ErfK/SrfK